MDAQQFLADFGHIVNAPGGVVRLRELVLQLAISGRLVDRGVSETPVSESLESAARQRQQYEKDFQLRTTRLHPPMNAKPYAIPAHWHWTRLEKLSLYVQRGKGPKYSGSGAVSVVSQKCVQWSCFDPRKVRFVADESLAGYGKERFLCNGDLLLNSTGTGTVGRVAICSNVSEDSFVADSHVTVIRLSKAAAPRYVWCVVASPWVQARIQPTHPDSLVSGTTQQVELATSTVRALPIPLPPIEEQSFIVTKVDELMALCDQLEQQQQGRRKLQNALRHSTLQAVANAQNQHELQDSLNRLEGNFGWLFSEPEDLGCLEQCIKQLALKGFLTLAKPNEAISEDLERNAESLSTVNMLEEAWQIPSHWIWAKSAWLGEARLGKMLDASKNRGELRPYLRNINVRWHRFDLSDVLQMRVEEHELQRVRIKRGDLVICEGGEPGRAAIWDRDDEFVIQKALHRFRCGSHVLSEYLLFCLEHDYFSGRLARYYTGATIKHLTGKALAEYSIPLPPINEQHRILVVTQALASFVTNLRAELGRSNRCAELLATAAVAALTGITIKQEEDEPVKAPQIELIAPIRLGTPPDIKAQAPLAALLARYNGEMSSRDLWQRFGGEIDAFYAQLKTEVAHGWIAEPEVAVMREKFSEVAEG